MQYSTAVLTQHQLYIVRFQICVCICMFDKPKIYRDSKNDNKIFILFINNKIMSMSNG